MSHYHASQSLDGSAPENIGTNRHMDELTDMLRFMTPAFAVLGWELQMFAYTGDNACVAEFRVEHGSHNHDMRISIWECSCSTGERELQEADKPEAPPFN